MVFQDPYGSLDPRQKVARIVAEPLGLLRLGRAEAAERTIEALAEVGLGAEALDRYPHEFSGGQRQRIAIARALITRPALLVADEPVSALDVSVQAQVLNLLAELQRRHGLALLFISHDLAVVAHLADRIAVMQAGKVVEEGPRDQVLDAPSHPYTRNLLAAVLPPDPAKARARLGLVRKRRA
jgi:peptide/nickel transport system ATP-binding protein